MSFLLHPLHYNSSVVKIAVISTRRTQRQEIRLQIYKETGRIVFLVAPRQGIEVQASSTIDMKCHFDKVPINAAGLALVFRLEGIVSVFLLA